MSPSTKIWLVYSLLGLFVSLGLVELFEAVPAIRLLSNEAVVFGIMTAFMGGAISKAVKVASQTPLSE